MPDCTHHWKIETPDGRERVGGHCVKCGKTGTFRTSLDDVFQMTRHDTHHLFDGVPARIGTFRS